MDATKEVKALLIKQYRKKTGQGQLFKGQAQLTLSYGQARVRLYPWQTNNTAVVEILELYINPAHRQKGHGTRAMKTLCRWADQKELTLFGQAVPLHDCSLSTEALIKWYKTFDFTFNEYEEGTRKPRRLL